jgi:ribosomal protein S18 acetylase RimI-like enzyme
MGRNMTPPYVLTPASADDQPFLEQLSRDVYRDLFVVTFGGWDEARHLRHVEDCWRRGHISIIEVSGVRIGMIQLVENANVIEVSELQIAPPRQNRGLGSRVLRDIIGRAHRDGRPVVLSVGLQNEKAYRLYGRLGFRQACQTATHRTMINEASDQGA